MGAYSEDGGVGVIVESVGHLFNPIISNTFKRSVPYLETIPRAPRLEQ